MSFKTYLLSVFIFALAIPVQTSRAQTILPPGSPDPTFGANGRVLTEVEGACYNVHDTILLPDNKILSLCNQTVYRGSIAHNYFVLIRHNSDGSPDNDFGAGGVKTIPAGSGGYGFHNYGEKLHLQPDGKIIIVATLNSDLGMVRINSDGSIDPSFGVNGRVGSDFSGFEENSKDFVTGLAVRPDGKLLLYGKSYVQDLTFSCTWWTNPSCDPPEFQRVALAQYDANGSPDLAFGERGIQRSRFTNDYHYPKSIVLQPDGTFFFIVGVYEKTFMGDSYHLLFTQIAVRYNADGWIDTGYGKEGATEMPNAVFQTQPDGRFIGFEQCNQPWLCAENVTRFLRLNSDFSRDMTFGANGVLPYYLVYYRGGALHSQPDGKFIFSVYPDAVYTSAPTALYRFNSDGSVDFSFGNNGAIVFELDGNPARPGSRPKILIQPDGKILAVCAFYPDQNTTGPSGVALMRFIGRNNKHG